MSEAINKNRLFIYGAGLAGLLAGNILRRHSPYIMETQSALPDNHGALLRFRTNEIAQAVNIPFKKVRVNKQVRGQCGELKDKADICDKNEYSYKLFKKIVSRSIGNLDDCTRYIAPDDFTFLLSAGLSFTFDYKLDLEKIKEHEKAGDYIISTIPMPSLMKIVGWKDAPEFKWRSIWSVSCTLPIECDVYQTIYYPHTTGEEENYYRASITGNRFIMEFLKRPYSREVSLAHNILNFNFGIRHVDIKPNNWDMKYQKYGKLLPTDDDKRKSFILAMTDLYKIYSVGRFATWRQLLLDDVLDDIYTVDRFMCTRSFYDCALETWRPSDG